MVISNKIDYAIAIKRANEATEAYDMGHPIMSDATWDEIFYAIKEFENEYGIVFDNSPTQTVYETVSSLEKVKHNHPMLSLDKTKDIKDIENYFGKAPVIVMAKMDGLTCSLTYEKGRLVRAETRGNGEVGENILHNAIHISSIPRYIDRGMNLTVDGEIIVKISDFENMENKGANPRNTAAGAIRRLDSRESQKVHLTFVAWDMPLGDYSQLENFGDRLQTLNRLGFVTVPWWANYEGKDLDKSIEGVRKDAARLSYPIDGAVIRFDSIAKGNEMGQTAHHFKHSLAFKFYDESAITELTGIEYSMGRTGVITPIALFNPVEIDGATIKRASLHNISVMTETLGNFPYKGERIEVIRANQIIPMILPVPDIVRRLGNGHGNEFELINCPSCGEPLAMEVTEGTINAVCHNKHCPSKFINQLVHFCGKNGLDIKGLSEASLTTFVDEGWISCFADIFKLAEHKEEMVRLVGWGNKSVSNVLLAIEVAKNTQLWRVLSAAGIPGIGARAAKQLAAEFDTFDDFIAAVNNGYSFSNIKDFGMITEDAILTFNYDDICAVVQNLNVTNDNRIIEGSDTPKPLSGKSIAITGRLKKVWKTRDELERFIIENGGTIANLVTHKTDYLIANQASNTGKYANATVYKIPILTEQEFQQLVEKRENI